MRIPTRLEATASLVRRRVRRMSPEQMSLWLSAAGTDMSLALDHYVRSREAADLVEFDRGVATLLAMSEVLHGRSD